jgi:hypothetical protein
MNLNQNRFFGITYATENGHEIWVGKPEGKKPLVRHWHSLEDNIKMDLEEKRVSGCGMDSTGTGYSPKTGFCEHCNERLCFIKGGKMSSRATISFSRTNLFYGGSYTD